MADSGTGSIDRLFDFVDNTIEKVDRVLNRAKYTEDQHRSRHAKRPEVIDAASEVKGVKVKKTSSSTAVATRRFRIVEAIAPETGETLFVVTNNVVRAECNTREVAEKVLVALEAAP